MATSKIFLILLSTGEAFIVDLRKGHAGRFELYDQHEGDDQRCVSCWYKAISLTWWIPTVLQRSLWSVLTPQADTFSLEHQTAPSLSSIAGLKQFVTLAS